MRNGALPVLAWAAWITLLATVLGVWASWDWQAWAEFLSAAGLAWLVGVAFLLRPGRERERRLPDYSLSTVALGFGVVFALVGALVGWWLVLVGAGLAVGGLGGLVRERA